MFTDHKSDRSLISDTQARPLRDIDVPFGIVNRPGVVPIIGKVTPTLLNLRSKIQCDQNLPTIVNVSNSYRLADSTHRTPFTTQGARVGDVGKKMQFEVR